ncbi:Cyanovirin-N [Apiosordaria backusii]|uniref:Cyanovirin-N n=1 Tax=Apiosordaria backusii TaxID=314023 RepID=A0AA40EA76_9PEZI|nr:Cyanovirin-N [Apiosordaria backusii]
MLHCECRRLDGSYQPTSISLNKIIENSNGSFRWVSGGANINSCGNKPSSVTVQPGDTLRDIAQRQGTTWQELAQINCIQNPDLIHPGQVIKLPGGGGHGGQVGGNFGASARNVRLEGCGKRLVGELLRSDGCWVSSSLTLDERIGNANGTLQFK